MFDSVKQHMYEGLRVSAELRDKIQERWNVDYVAVEETRGSLEREFGVEVLQGHLTASPAIEQPVRVTGDVINLETRSEQQILRELREQSEQDQQLAAIRENIRREAA